MRFTERLFQHSARFISPTIAEGLVVGPIYVNRERLFAELLMVHALDESPNRDKQDYAFAYNVIIEALREFRSKGEIGFGPKDDYYV